MDPHPTFRLVKGWTEELLDWLEWSQVAAVLGVGMILWAAVQIWLRPGGSRRTVVRRAALWTIGGMVAGALVGATAFALTNLALMHLGGQDHLWHFHARLVRQAAMTGAALGAGGAAVVATLRRRGAVEPPA